MAGQAGDRSGLSAVIGPWALGFVTRLRSRHDPRHETFMKWSATGSNPPFLSLQLANLFAQHIDVSEIAHGVASTNGFLAVIEPQTARRQCEPGHTTPRFIGCLRTQSAPRSVGEVSPLRLDAAASAMHITPAFAHDAAEMNEWRDPHAPFRPA
jgi:hypothetical protein